MGMSEVGQHNHARIDPAPHNMFELMEDFRYQWMADGQLHRITISAGQMFDGASIPVTGTVLTAILPGLETIYPMGQHIYAALVHDKIWEYKGRLPYRMHEYFDNLTKKWENVRDPWTFTSSNKLFARMLREDGVGGRERKVMYLSVQFTPIAWWKWHTGKVPPDAQR